MGSLDGRIKDRVESAGTINLTQNISGMKIYQFFSKQGRLAYEAVEWQYRKSKEEDYGWKDAGDIVLKSLADLLKQKEDIYKDFYCGRWGGEEFLVIQLLEKDQKEKVIDRLEEIRKQVEAQVISYQDVEIKYTVTIGAAFCDADTKEAYLITEADQMLYEGK